MYNQRASVYHGSCGCSVPELEQRESGDGQKKQGGLCSLDCNAGFHQYELIEESAPHFRGY
jgi:hypothetical protein